MEGLRQYQNQIAFRLLFGFLGCIALIIVASQLAESYIAVGLSILGALMIASLTIWSVNRIISTPFDYFWQAILYATAREEKQSPDLSSLRGAQVLTSTMVHQLYLLVNRIREDQSLPDATKNNLARLAVESLPLPMVVFDANQNINYLNPAALAAFAVNAEGVLGSNVNEALNLMFSNNNTFERWLKEVNGSSVTETNVWNRVRITDNTNQVLCQGDLVAYYNRGQGDQFLGTLTFFDRTEAYSNDDNQSSFVALAVHELRTPLTIMRGYVEVFEEELSGKLDAELQDFMQKLSASTQQLTAFVSNILNVARVEQNQFELHLEKQDWSDILHAVGNDMELRAKVNGRRIEYNIHPGLPSVGADRVSVYEVLMNLLDNAIKYGGESERIILSARLNKDGQVETTVQDFGVGIATAVLPNLFEKFYRSHRSRSQATGTGLGLYLSKTIVEAHGGQVWVQSKEGEGSIFGFTLRPFEEIADTANKGDNKEGISRRAHGWIKNHSLYRR